MAETIKLSVLICSIPERAGNKFTKLLNKLISQVKEKPVEIIWLGDNKKISIGAKRNNLRLMAQGDYQCFIDDDDDISKDYIDSILKAIRSDSDVICFNAERYVDGLLDRPVFYSKEYGIDSNTNEAYLRLPNHLMVFKSNIVLKHLFKQINFGEDYIFANKILPDIKSETIINKVLYYYNYNTKLSTGCKHGN